MQQLKSRQYSELNKSLRLSRSIRLAAFKLAAYLSTRLGHTAEPAFMEFANHCKRVCEYLRSFPTKSQDCVICLPDLLLKRNLTGINLTNLLSSWYLVSSSLRNYRKKTWVDKAGDRKTKTGRKEIKKITSLVKSCFYLIFALSLLQQSGVNYLARFLTVHCFYHLLFT